MRHVLIIGNGFDIANGMPTKFTDFANHLLEEVLIPDLKNNIHNISNSKYFNDILDNYKTGRVFDTSSGIKYSLVELLESFSQKRFRDALLNQKLLFLEHLKNNFLYQLYKEFHTYWFDIESTYFKRISSIRRSIDPTNINPDRIRALELLNQEFDEIKSLLKEYLSGLKIEPSNSLAIFLKNLIHSNATRNDELMIINFNYTRTVLTFDLGKVMSNYIDIHGNLGTEIIFGWGNDKDSSYLEIKECGIDEFMKNFKTHQYSINDNYQYIHNILIENANPFEVHVLGHSLGQTDKSLLQEIMESENCLRINLYKRADKYNSDIENDFDQIEVRKEFTKLTMALSRIIDDRSVRLKVNSYENSSYFPDVVPF